MKKFKSTFSIVAIAILIISLSFFTHKITASTGNNLSGYAWSSNIGWVRLNNCTKPSDASTCGPVNYGVSVLPSAPGTVSGYAWSSNIGWISFDSSTFGTCPAGSGCQANIDWAAAGTSKPMKGWARACTVFQSGCSGAFKDPTALGGWDGWISLSGTNYGVAMDTTKNKLGGFAWGGDVIGWLSFAGNGYDVTFDPTGATLTLTANPTSVAVNGASTLTWSSTGMSSCTGSKVSGNGTVFNTGGATSGNTSVTIPNDTVYRVTCNLISGGTTSQDVTITTTGAPVLGFSQPFASGGCVNATGMNPQLTWTAQAATSCILSRGSSTENVGPSAQASGGTAVGSVYYYTPNLPVNANPTQYGLSCTDGASTINATPITVSVCVTPQPDFSVTGSPTSQQFSDGTVGSPYEGMKVASFNVITKGVLGFNSDVALSAVKGASMPPSTILTPVSPATVHEIGSGTYDSATFMVTMSAADFAANPRGAWPITIKGTADGKTRTGNVIVGAKVKPIYIEH